MFAIPGIAVLLIFVYIKPQELWEPLTKVPFAYLVIFGTVFGYVLDLRLRVTTPQATPQLRWAILLMVWLVITVVLQVPASAAIPHLIAVTMSMIMFFTIAHGVQTLRGLRIVAGVNIAIGLLLAFIGVHQGLSPKGCARVVTAADMIAEPDGRLCETNYECYVDGEPGRDYVCEHIGLWGTTSVDERVRYRGVLQDPNELALAVCAVMPLLFAFASRSRSARNVLLTALGVGLIFWCVMYTQSRGGQLVFLTVLGVYFVKRYGYRGLLVGAVLALPMLLLGGREGGSEASASTEGRYEAWAAGFYMFTGDPFLGVGSGEFTQHHYLTAHNSYVLAAAEMGLLGMVLWAMVVYVSVKIVYCGVRDFADRPGAEAARVWGLALLASMAACLVQMLFLSLSYHNMLWIYFGLCGAYYSAVKHHAPDWEVRIGARDVALVTLLCIGFWGALFVFLKWKLYI